jgi:hypothetical protein
MYIYKIDFPHPSIPSLASPGLPDRVTDDKIKKAAPKGLWSRDCFKVGALAGALRAILGDEENLPPWFAEGHGQGVHTRLPGIPRTGRLAAKLRV